MQYNKGIKMFNMYIPQRLTSTLLVLFLLTVTACTHSIGESKNNEMGATPRMKFSGELPVSTRIIKGKLDNGITYIIRNNITPKNRAELRLVINAGSILEDDNQQGFAHFVEHMAFNGTEDFAKQEIVDYVESIGMKFGAHLNAHTGFDETVYKLQLPIDDQQTLEKGMHILENWAHKLSFDATEIDKERGVVIEELRARKGANDRIFKKQLPVIAKNSQYAQRLPIGKQEILANGSHENLIRYYKEWYRPDLMAVIAVGDFEPIQIEALITKYFADIKQIESPRKRTVYSIPKNEIPLVSIETDAELPRIISTVQIKQPLLEPKTYEEYRTQLATKLYIAMLNSRYAEISIKPDVAIVGAGSSFRRNFDASSNFIIGASIKPGQVKRALAEILREDNRALQHGFTESELTRAKNSLLRSLEKNTIEIDTEKSANYARKYVRHFMKGETLIGRVKALEAGKFFLAEITLEEVNSLGASWNTGENRIVTIAAPEIDKAKLPTHNQVTALWNRVMAEQTTKYQDTVVATRLMTKKPTPGSVVDKQFNEKLDTHYWILSNGAKVVLKQTDFKNDQVLFTAISAGGNSLIDDQTYVKTLLSDSAANYMGVAEFNQVALRKFMQGKKFSLRSKINNLSESISGYSSTQDLENFMQMLHLKFTSPRKDKQDFETLLSRIEPGIENRFKQPENVFIDKIRETQYGNDDVRHAAFDVARLKQQDFSASIDFYRERFANAGDFSFIFVGNIDLNEIEPLVNTYIASLPANNVKERFKILEDNRKPGVLNVTVHKGQEEKAQVKILLYGKANYSHQESINFTAMKSVLSTLLRERIREEKGGVYGVRVNGSIMRHPREAFKLDISFTCDPARVDELIMETRKVIRELKANKMDEKYLINFKEKLHKSRQVNIKENKFWKNYLSSIERFQGNVIALDEYNQLVNSVTLENIQRAAKLYLSAEDNLLAKLLPQEKILKNN